MSLCWIETRKNDGFVLLRDDLPELLLRRPLGQRNPFSCYAYRHMHIGGDYHPTHLTDSDKAKAYVETLYYMGGLWIVK